MKNKYILSIVLLILAMSSCRSIKFQDSKTVDIANNIYQYPTVANLEVQSEKIVSSITFKRPWYRNSVSKSNLEMFKGQVVADAVKNAAADILLEPQFVIEQGDKKLSIKLTLSGYPAKYKNFRAATKEDTEMLLLSEKTSGIVSVDKYEPKVVIKNNIFQTIKGWFKRN